MSEGIKYDQGKPRVGEMIQDFCEPLALVAEVWAFGADKYGRSNWKDVADGERRYTNALCRHLMKENLHATDEESNLLHATHVAWNALARLYFIAQNMKENSNEGS